MLSLATLVFFLDIFLSLSSLAIGLVTPRVILESGQWEGITATVPGSLNTVHKYLGIRYGAAPIRFDVAAPAPPSNALIQATENPPACIQAKNTTEKESEDCLFLNIYTPSPNEQSDKAVMIFLFGGGFQSGSASHSMYDGSSFAANQDVIVVVPNYRTNGMPFRSQSNDYQANMQQSLAFLVKRLGIQ
jgi:carboxylesterase type B